MSNFKKFLCNEKLACGYVLKFSSKYTVLILPIPLFLHFSRSSSDNNNFSQVSLSPPPPPSSPLLFFCFWNCKKLLRCALINHGIRVTLYFVSRQYLKQFWGKTVKRSIRQS